MSPTGTPDTPLAAVDLLHRTIDLLEQHLGTDPAPAPEAQLVFVSCNDDGIDLGLLPLDDDEPATLIQGYTAPPEWWAMGIVARGTARCLDDQGAPGWPVAVIHVVARSGEAAAAHRRPGAESACRSTLDGTEWGGLLDDHLRRALGLPTAPPPASSLPFWTALWLDVLCLAALAGDLARASWIDLARRHPARRLLPGVGDHTDLVWAGEALAERWPWPALRAAAGTPRDPLGTVPAELAAWMDDGLFARLHASGFPDVDDLLAALDSALDAAVMAQLRDCCRAWSIQT